MMHYVPERKCKTTDVMQKNTVHSKTWQTKLDLQYRRSAVSKFHLVFFPLHREKVHLPALKHTTLLSGIFTKLQGIFSLGLTE